MMKMILFWSLGMMALVLVVIAVGVAAFLQHPKFGELPAGAQLAAIQSSPNYVDNEFRNQIDTPLFTEDQSFLSVVLGNLRTPDPNVQLQPAGSIPVVEVDFHSLDVNQDCVIWLGHSSYYIQLAGKRILLDPVFSRFASPLPFINRAYAGTSPYTVDDMPPIDVLLISHDHWDHLDYPTLLALKSRVQQVVVGLGMGSYFRGWGYDADNIIEGDWDQSFELSPALTVHVIPARHYSGRALKRNQTLWVGFVLESPQRRLLFSGDSGYGPHFAAIGKRFDGFDLVALDQGQYDPRWAYIHMTPEQAAQAAQELGAAALLPAHVGRFTLARHAWDDPFQRIAKASKGKGYRLLTPKIGETVRLTDGEPQSFEAWW